MAFYDQIAKQWHAATGFRGGAFKELVLNDILLRDIDYIGERRILELGAGNGYFMPLVMRRYSGQIPAKLVITDQSKRQLATAQRHFRVQGALYELLDVGKPFPFSDHSFDLILATMVFNEVSAQVFKHALGECYRVLGNEGLLLMTVSHPDFIDSLNVRGLTRADAGGVLTMPGSGQLRLPVVLRSMQEYQSILKDAGFVLEAESVYPSQAVLNSKAGLRYAKTLPLALVFKCTKWKSISPDQSRR